MINIAFIIDSIETPSAGTEKQLLLLLHGIDKTRFAPHLICLYQSEWMKSKSFPCPVEYLNIRKLVSLDFFKALKRFKKLQAQYSFDIVQTFFPDANIVGTIAAHKTGVPIIISSRRNVGYWHNRKHISMLRYLRKKTTNYLANSQAAAQLAVEVEQVDPATCHVIYNGLPLFKFHDIDEKMRRKQRDSWHLPANAIVIGCIANLRPVKRIDRLIEAAKQLCPAYPNLYFIAVGEGEERPRLQQLIDTYIITDRFQLVGRMEEPLPALAAFDIAALPSANESFSNALVEYMAAGLPIVAGNVGGNAEAISHMETGLLYDPTQPNAVTTSLKMLLDQPNLAKQLAHNAKENALATYSIERMVRNHEQYYESLFISSGKK